MPAWVVLVQLFIGMGWARAATEKVIDPAWWNGTVLTEFVAAHRGTPLGWYGPFLENVVAPNVLMVSAVVLIAQVFAAFALVSGQTLLPGLAVGVLLNLNFVAAGAVNPSIFYLICQVGLVLWAIERNGAAGKRPLRLLATVSVALAVVNAPFVATLSPAGVIEDPAIILVTLGLLTAIASRVGVAAPGPADQEA